VKSAGENKKALNSRRIVKEGGIPGGEKGGCPENEGGGTSSVQEKNDLSKKK